MKSAPQKTPETLLCPINSLSKTSTYISIDMTPWEKKKKNSQPFFHIHDQTEQPLGCSNLDKKRPAILLFLTKPEPFGIREDVFVSHRQARARLLATPNNVPEHGNNKEQRQAGCIDNTTPNTPK